MTKENFLTEVYKAIREKHDKNFKEKTKSYYQAVIDDLWKVNDKLTTLSGSNPTDTELNEFVIKISGDISLTTESEKKAQKNAPNAVPNAAPNEVPNAATKAAENAATKAAENAATKAAANAATKAAENAATKAVPNERPNEAANSPKIPKIPKTPNAPNSSYPRKNSNNAVAKAEEKEAEKDPPSPKQQELYTNIEKKLKELQTKMESKTRQDFQNRYEYHENQRRQLMKQTTKKPKKQLQEPTIQGIGQSNFQYLINLFLIIQKLKGVTGEGSDNNLKDLISKYIYIKSKNEKVSKNTYQKELEEYKQDILQQKKIESIQYFNKYFEILIEKFWSNADNSEIDKLKLKNNSSTNAKVV